MEKLFHKPRDIVGGVMVAGVGLAFLLTGRELDAGTTFRMGPGYFPSMLSVLLMAMGAALVVQALRGEKLAHDFDNVPWKGLLLITGSIVMFGALLRGIGLFPAVAGVAFLTALISRFSGWKTAVVLALSLAAASVLIFTYGLGLPLPMFGKWLNLAALAG